MRTTSQSQSVASPTPGQAWELGRRWLREALEERTAPGVMTMLSLPAPRACLESFLDALPSDERLLWRPPEGASWAGIGAAHRLDVTGSGWKEELAAHARELFERLETHALYGAPHVPRLVGGLAFAPTARRTEPWAPLGAGRFVLPRWTYSADADGGTLSLAVDGRPPQREVGRWLDEAAQIVEALARDGFQAADEVDASGATLSGGPPERWMGLVDEIRAGIEAGRFRKVVAARHSILEMPGPIDPLAVTARLDAAYPDCFRFAFASAGRTFVGATPERLVARRGNRLFSGALAGSIAAPEDGSPGPAEALLASRKEALEHELVVDAVREALLPYCEPLEMPEQPEVLALRHVLHLFTPAVGTLRRPAHVLDLVEALHPTPAVGGLPREAALGWIAEHEGAERGWYAGPVGWFDGLGDGEFAVGIRSALVMGRRAWVYAGAGIVGDSDAEAEYAETELKQRAMLRALGYQR